ncbi:MAG: hypothetical protein KKA73_15580 [Chloroflexi bacterium]|nr:hypothetical protein [Chloroflexota bacterium]
MKRHVRRQRHWCTFSGVLCRDTGMTGRRYARCPVCRRRLRVRHIYCNCCRPPCFMRTVLPPHKTK